MQKFIYFYSPIYEIYHNHISECLSISGINYSALKIDDIQKDKSSWHTFYGGVSVKIQLLVDCIKKHFGQDIVFSDCTIVFNKTKLKELGEYFDLFDGYDLCWQKNHVPDTGYNIGITKVKCNEKMLVFFEKVLDRITINKGWDQGVCNDVFIEQKEQISFQQFDQKIITDERYNKNLSTNSFLIWKHLILHEGKTQEEILKARLEDYKQLGIII